jgi:hypothetical protein
VAAAVLAGMASAVVGAAHAHDFWSTAQLSVARANIAAASVGNVALFAGGEIGGALLYRGGGKGRDDCRVCVCVCVCV